jgi:hypothetical protein
MNFPPNGLPGRLRDARQKAAVGQFPHAQTAKGETAEKAFRPTASLAPVVLADLKLETARSVFNDETCFRHDFSRWPQTSSLGPFIALSHMA